MYRFALTPQSVLISVLWYSALLVLSKDSLLHITGNWPWESPTVCIEMWFVLLYWFEIAWYPVPRPVGLLTLKPIESTFHTFVMSHNVSFWDSRVIISLLLYVIIALSFVVLSLVFHLVTLFYDLKKIYTSKVSIGAFDPMTPTITKPTQFFT